MKTKVDARVRPSGKFVRQAVTLLFVLAGVRCFPLAAQPTNSSAVLLEQAAQNLGQVKSVFAHFIQERHLSLFEEPLRSEGYLCFEKPGRLRWEITQPYQSILVSDGQDVAQFEWVSGRWKKLDLGLADALQNVVSQIGAVMEGRYTGQQRDYNVTAADTAGGPVVTLTPQHPMLRKMLLAIEVHLARDFKGTRRVVLREVDGDFTSIQFTEQLANPSWPAGTFDRRQPVDLDKIRRAVQPQAGNQGSTIK